MIINIVRLLLSPDINEITNQLIDQVNEEQIPDNEYEDVKINMPVEDYNQYIGFKRPVKDDIGKVCSICFDTIKSTEKRVSITKCCNNVFHTRCLKKWLTKECSLQLAQCVELIYILRASIMFILIITLNMENYQNNLF